MAYECSERIAIEIEGLLPGLGRTENHNILTQVYITLPIHSMQDIQIDGFGVKEALKLEKMGPKIGKVLQAVEKAILSDELKKTTVEDNLVKLINKLIDYEITINDIKYEYFEFTTQEFVGNFYKFHNIISYFFKALTRRYNDLDKVQYYNFDKNQNKFYTTGFTFQPTSGWKIRLYSKGHENNKKNLKKVKGAIFRLEHRLSKKIIKNYFEFNSVNSIKIEDIKNYIQSTISQALGKIMIEEVEKSVEILKEKFVDFRCQDLDSLVRDNLEWIFDYKIIDDIVTSSSNKCYRQIVFYRSKIKNILIHSQQRGSPQRDFFSNIERLEQFLVNIILFNCKIKCDTKKHLAFFCKK